MHLFQGVSRGKIVEQRQDRDHVIVPVGLAVEADTAASLPSATIVFLHVVYPPRTIMAAFIVTPWRKPKSRSASRTSTAS